MLPTMALAATLLFAAAAAASPGHKPGEAHDHRAYGYQLVTEDVQA